MFELNNKSVLVLGLGSSGQAASRFMPARGATVVALNEAASAVINAQSA
jgi:UDP-N-acetylmuramoylalanine-D-glutamate ligase